MDIISMPIEFKDNEIKSKYRLVIIASQKAKQLIQGNIPHLKKRYKKETSIAIEEAISGKIRYLTGEEARIAQKEAIKLRDDLKTRLRDDIKERKKVREDVVEEIKRELSVYVDDSKNDDTRSNETE